MDAQMATRPSASFRRYLCLKDAASYLGLSAKTLYVWAEHGSIPSYKLGRVWRFDQLELDEFVRKGLSTSAQNG